MGHAQRAATLLAVQCVVPASEFAARWVVHPLDTSNSAATMQAPITNAELGKFMRDMAEQINADPGTTR
jgi:hypothetical protein